MKVLKGICFAVFILLGLVFFIGVVTGSDSEDVSQESSKRSYQVTLPQNSYIQYDLRFHLEAGKKGDFGKILTYNAGTECEETFYAYYVPSGKYIVTNKGYYTTQVNVYSDEIQIVNGWEEPKDCQCYLISKDQSKQIIVEEGFHIEIAEPTYILMERVASVTGGSKEPQEQPSAPPAENASYTVVDEYYYLSRSSGLLYVNYFCIVKNTGTTNLLLDYSEFEISNKSGTILDNYKAVYGIPVVIAPGEIGVYQCDFSFYHSEFTEESYEFVITSDLNIKKTTKDIITLETSNILFSENDGGYIVVRGNLANNTSKNLENCFWVALLYNESDKIIGVVEGMSMDLDAGRNMNFDGSYKYNKRAGSVKRYEIIAIAVE